MSLPIEELKVRLKEALSSRNMKPVELAEKTGIPKSAISQYMSGYAKPKQDRITLMSKALGIEEAWLLGYNVPMDKNEKYLELFSGDSRIISANREEENLVLYYRKLNSYGKKKLVENAEDLLQIEKYTSTQIINADHEGTDIDVPNNTDTSKDDINESVCNDQTTSIPDTPEELEKLYPPMEKHSDVG